MSNIEANTLSSISLALREGESITSVLSKVGTKAEAKAPVAFKKPEIPAQPEMSADVRAHLVKLPQVFGVLSVTERRSLEETEVSALYEEYETLNSIADLMSTRKEALKELIRNHIDVVAEKVDEVDKDAIDSNGHYLVASKGNPVRVNIPGSNKAFSLEYRAGRSGSMKISSERLLDLYEAGEITREDYLSLTREVRVFDEARATKAIVAKPELIDIVSRASVVEGATAPSQGLYVRNAK